MVIAGGVAGAAEGAASWAVGANKGTLGENMAMGAFFGLVTAGVIHGGWGTVRGVFGLGTATEAADEFATQLRRGWYDTAGFLSLRARSAASSLRSARTGGRPKVGHCSFTAGTEVAILNGEMNVEDIALGDFVWAYDGTTSRARLAQVTELYDRVALRLVVITIGEETIKVTGEHPFWVWGEGWVEAQYLKAGDSLVTLGGEQRLIEEIRLQPGSVVVYNFSVDLLENYFASKWQVLVHNCLEEGIAYRSVTEQEADNILAGEGILAGGPIKGREGQALALLGHTDESAFIPATHINPGGLKKGDPGTFIRFRTEPLGSKFVPQEVLQQNKLLGERLRWVGQQHHALVKDEIPNSVIEYLVAFGTKFVRGVDFGTP